MMTSSSQTYLKDNETMVPNFQLLTQPTELTNITYNVNIHSINSTQRSTLPYFNEPI